MGDVNNYNIVVSGLIGGKALVISTLFFCAAWLYVAGHPEASLGTFVFGVICFYIIGGTCNGGTCDG